MTNILLFFLLLQWNTVSSDIDGAPLDPGNHATDYKVYACTSAKCTPANATFVATVPAENPQKPTRSLDISGLPKPQTYFVTVINVSGESAPSVTIRVTPPKSVDGLVMLP